MRDIQESYDSSAEIPESSSVEAQETTPESVSEDLAALDPELQNEIDLVANKAGYSFEQASSENFLSAMEPEDLTELSHLTYELSQTVDASARPGVIKRMVALWQK